MPSLDSGYSVSLAELQEIEPLDVISVVPIKEPDLKSLCVRVARRFIRT